VGLIVGLLAEKQGRAKPENLHKVFGIGQIPSDTQMRMILGSSDHEYLINGSEDEEFLTRLNEEQAAEYLNRPMPES
jgi:hypothetical protein